MADKPTTAFALSLIGGIITLISGLLWINSWFFLYSISGTNFTYWVLGDLVSFTSGEALVLFIIGAICGISIMAGAVLQFSEKKSRVWRGSILVLVASIIGIPSTFFGMLIGGILSVLGAWQGLVWKPKSALTTDAQAQNMDSPRQVISV